MKKFLLFLLFTVTCYSQPAINNEFVIGKCSSNNTAVFNITDAYPYILNGLNPEDYSITAHTTYAQAVSNTNAITNPTAYPLIGGPQTLYVRVTTISNPSSYTIAFGDLIIFYNPLTNPDANLNINLEDNDGNLNGSTIFDLTSLNEDITYGEPLILKFYTSLENVESDNPITNPQTFIATTQTLYFNATAPSGCVSATSPLYISVNSSLTIGVPNDINICIPNTQNDVSVYIQQDSNILNGLPSTDYTVSYHVTNDDAVAGINAIADPESYILPANEQTIYVRLTEIVNTANFKTASFEINALVTPTANTVEPIIVFVENEDDTTIVDLTFTIPEILGSQSAEINTVSFYLTESDAESGTNALADAANFVTSTQLIFFRIESLEGCYNIGSFNIIVTNVPSPTGASEQTFNEGQTLADIEVEGENIKWYDNSGEGPVFPDGTSEPLPLSTVLVDGETYYASQTINGVESMQRLAVTVNLILNNEDFIFNGLRYYPNPANNILSIENKTEINSVSIANALGQTVITKAVNSNAVQVDVTSLSKGFYFVTLNSGNAGKTVKIIKE